MSEWKTVLLGDICKTNTTSYSKNDEWEYVNYLDTGNITVNSIDTIQCINLNDGKLPSRAKRKVKFNSIIYSTVRPNQCHYGIIKDFPDNFLVSTGFTVIDVNEKLADADYIYYWLSQNAVTERLHSIAEQSTSAYPSIKPSDLESLELELPPLDVQKKAASILASLDRKGEKNTEINMNLLDQSNSLFNNWFVEFKPFGGTRPEDWNEGILDDIVEFSNGYAFKGKELLDAPDLEKDCYHVFKQGHINRGGGFNITGTKSWYPKELAANLQKYVLHKGDILMAMTDMKDKVAILGNTAVMEFDGEYIVNQRVGLLRPNGAYGIHYPYISLLTNSYDFLKDLRSRANSGVQVNLSSNEIRNSTIYIAPEKINYEFNELIMPMFETIISNDIENLRLADLRDALLPKLMSGELDVSDLEI